MSVHLFLNEKIQKDWRDWRENIQASGIGIENKQKMKLPEQEKRKKPEQDETSCLVNGVWCILWT